MTVREDLQKLLIVERERDSAREENVRLRNKLLECAKQCTECDGTGVITYAANRIGPCPDCADIREVLDL